MGAALLCGVAPPLRKASIFKLCRGKTARQVVDGLLATTVGVEEPANKIDYTAILRLNCANCLIAEDQSSVGRSGPIIPLHQQKIQQ